MTFFRKVKVKYTKISVNESMIMVHYKQSHCVKIYKLVKNDTGIMLMSLGSGNFDTLIGMFRGISDLESLANHYKNLNFTVVEYTDMLSDVSAHRIMHSLLQKATKS